MCYGYHVWSKEALMQAENDDDLGGQRSSEVKWGKLCVLWLPFWSKEALMQAENDDDLDGGQRSEVKCKLSDMTTIFGQKNCWCKLRMMMTLMEVKGHQRSNMVTYMPWLPYLVKRIADARMMMTFMEVKGHQRSNVVNYATKLGRKSSWCEFRMTVTFMEVKGQQRSNTVNNIWYLVNR